MREYLVYFASKNHDFRIAELTAVAQIFNIPIEIIDQPPPIISIPIEVSEYQNPFVRVLLPNNEAAMLIASRCVGMFAIFELWGKAKNYDELKIAIESWRIKNPDLYHSCVKERSFKFVVECFGRKFTGAEQVERINKFAWMDWQGKVNLKNPEEIYYVFEEADREQYDLINQKIHQEQISQRKNQATSSLEETDHSIPFNEDTLIRSVCLARRLAIGARSLLDEFNLKKRYYLGTTSMEAEIAFFTANQAKVRSGSIVLDPFVGTGSLLIACAKMGAYCYGADIDINVLTGNTRLKLNRRTLLADAAKKGKSINIEELDKSVKGNFDQYGLGDHLLDLWRLDTSNQKVFRPSKPWIDAIICDPPYGLRAGARKVGIKLQTAKKHEERGTKPGPVHLNPNDPGWLPHVPQTVPYSVPDVLRDLLDLAARMLVLNGRLVYWLPTARLDYHPSDLPTHPCFKIVGNSEQPLSTVWSRRLVSMEKVKDYDPSYVASVRDNEFENFDQTDNQDSSIAERTSGAPLKPLGHANIAAKITKNPNRHDGRQTGEKAPDLSDYKAVPTAAVRKRLRKLQRKAERQAAVTSGNLDSSPTDQHSELSSQPETSTDSINK